MSLKQKYPMFLRGTVYWCQDNETRKQESLGTKDRDEAERFLHAKNEAHRQPIINLQIARAYLMVSDPTVATRNWQDVMNEIVKLKKGETERRWVVAVKDKALDGLREIPLSWIAKFSSHGINFRDCSAGTTTAAQTSGWKSH